MAPDRSDCLERAGPPAEAFRPTVHDWSSSPRIDRGRTLLWMRSLDSFDALPLTGSDGASLPFWSPDARSIAFFVGNQLKRIDAGGGTPRKICDIVGDIGRGGTWGSGGDILFSSGNSPRLYRVPAEGGTAVALAGHTEKDVAVEAFWPYFLPDGRTFLLGQELGRRTHRVRRLDCGRRRSTEAAGEREQRRLRSLRFPAVHERRRAAATTVRSSATRAQRRAVASRRTDRAKHRTRAGGFFGVNHWRTGVPAEQ